MISLRLLATLVLTWGCSLAQPAIAGEPVVAPTRPFHLGFTRWPADLTLEGIQQAQDFAHAHGDLVSVMFIGGIPWPEALEGKPFSRDVELKSFGLTLRGSEADQRQFTKWLLRVATRDRYEFVINFATTDFERLCAKLPPPVDDLARIWAYTGLQTSALQPKPALTVWDAYLKAPYRRP